MNLEKLMHSALHFHRKACQQGCRLVKPDELDAKDCKDHRLCKQGVNLHRQWVECAKERRV